VGAVHRDQAGELVPASDQGEAAGRPGQQRPHLVGVGGVVQHDQHLPPCQKAAKAAYRNLMVEGNALVRMAQGANELSQYR